jgi:FkbM family methyltransferase
VVWLAVGLGRIPWRGHLDRLARPPATRWIAEILASLATSVRRRTAARLTYENGTWVHRFRDGVVVSGRIGADRPSGLAGTALDIFLHDVDLRPGDTVMDVGAGIGEESITFAKLVGPTGRVVAVEAHPLTFECLTRNLREHRLDGAEPVQVAVGDREGSIRISDDGGSSLANRIGGSTGFEVRLRTLDSLAEELAIQEVALLKINIEGAERLAIAGMDRVIDRVQNVCVSCHDFVADRRGPAYDEMRTRAEVLDYLQRAGFEVRTRQDSRPWVRDFLYGTRRDPT